MNFEWERWLGLGEGCGQKRRVAEMDVLRWMGAARVEWWCREVVEWL